jgi:hypothetical protein
MNDTEKKNGGKNAIVEALSQMNVPTILLILLSGGGNVLFTDKSGRQTDAELTQSIRQIHQLHDELDTALRNQKEIILRVEENTRSQKELAKIVQEKNQ